MAMEVIRKITKAWRIAATGISFAVFGMFGLSLSFVVIPLCCRLTRNKTHRHEVAQRCICASFQFFIRMMRGLGAIDYRIENAELLKEDDGCLIVANHPSLIDYVFLTSLMPRCDCVVKESLWNNFFMKGVIRSAGYIPNRDAEHVLNACREKFAQGSRILVFPEGTRSTPGEPMTLQRSAAGIAVRCNVDIRVVHITCTPPILTKQQKWYQTAPVRPIFVITIREKISLSTLTEKGTLPAHATRLLNKHLAQALCPDRLRPEKNYQ